MTNCEFTASQLNAEVRCGSPVHRRHLIEVSASESGKGGAVHSFRFLRKPVIHATTPSEPLLDGLSTAQGAFKVSFALALICQLMAVTASKDCPTVQDRHSPCASPRWAVQPRTLTTVVARRVRYPNRVFRLLPYLYIPRRCLYERINAVSVVRPLTDPASSPFLFQKSEKELPGSR